MPKDKLTAGEARRIALAAQGFAAPRPDGPIARRQLVKLVERLGVVQIDSVNVVSRTRYLPAFSRRGAYPRADLEEIACLRRPAPRPAFERLARPPHRLAGGAGVHGGPVHLLRRQLPPLRPPLLPYLKK